VTNGRARIPGRFAIDWMAPSESSGSGAEVLAVADAVVAAARGDMDDPTPCADRAPSGAVEDEAGNYIVLDLGRGRYAFYEHLRRGVLVREGDRVHRGQVVGALGCTGASPKPHLHFHVGDGPAPLAAEGMPYLLTDWRPSGVYDSVEDFFRGAKWREVPAEAPGPSLPGPNVVVWFRDR
jgi:murein DD-endopeptidase MepM/ murein hydrolase activator NlpD